MLNTIDYGFYLQFLFVGQFISNLLIFSVPASLYFFLPNSGHKKQQLLSQTFFYFIIISLIFIPIYQSCGIYLNSIFKDNLFYNKIHLPLGLYIIFSVISSLLEHLFIVEKKSNFVFFYNTLFIVSKLILITSSLIIFNELIAVFWSLVFIHFIISIILTVYLFKNYSLSIFTIKWIFADLLAQVKYVIPLGLSNVVNQIGKKADRFIISMFFSSTDFAIYGIANYKVPVVNLLFPSVSNIIVPEIAKNQKEGNIKEVIRLWHKMIIMLGAITIPTVMYFFIIANDLIQILFTEKYIDAVNIYRIFLLSMLILILRGTTILMAFGDTKPILNVQIFYMVASIIIGYTLIRFYGLYGGAITFLFISSMREIFYVYKSKQILKLPFKKCMPWNELGSISFISLIATPLAILISFTNFPILVKLILSFVSYFAVLSVGLNLLGVVNLKKIIMELFGKINN